MPRGRRTFVARVVEPAVYDPYTHGRIFEEVLNHIINPEITEIDDLGRGPRRPEEFDLLIFPEAFAPAPSLLVVLDAISRLQELGCVHVGLRPSAAKKHLFSVPQIEELVTSLKSVPRSVAEDLEAFESWLAVQDPSHRFNLGCLFAIDREHRLRICLHPKMVRSNLEHSAIPDEHMDQGNLVTLVTLLPSDRTMLSLTIQPLICSDALDLRTDGKTPPPDRRRQSKGERLRSDARSPLLVELFGSEA